MPESRNGLRVSRFMRRIPVNAWDPPKTVVVDAAAKMVHEPVAVEMEAWVRCGNRKVQGEK